MRAFIGGLVVGLVIGVILAASAPGAKKSNLSASSESNQGLAANPAKTVKWHLASAYSSDMPNSGSLGPALIERLVKISKGNITLQFHEPDGLVPVLDLFDAVSSGTVDTGLASSQFWGHKSPAFELFGAVPFGPEITSYLAWFRKHGGQKLYQDLYRRFNIHSIVCGVTGAAGAGWFEHPIETITDLKGLNIAATGLAAQIYGQLGAKTIKLAPSDLNEAFKQKKIDAVAFSTPAADYHLGLAVYGKHYYFPGWFQQTGFIDLIINMTKWNSLSKNQQEMINTTCMANIENSLAAGEASQFDALKNIVIRGVDVKKFPPEVTDGLRRAWLEIARKTAASNKEFRRVIRSLQKFREDYSIWQELGKI